MQRRNVLLSGLMILSLTVAVAWAQSTASNVPIQIAPNTINLDAEVIWITVHAEIPYSAVVGDSVTLNGVAADVTFADNRGELVAKLYLSSFVDLLEPGKNTLVLEGVTVDGSGFSGAGEVTVVQNSGNRR